MHYSDQEHEQDQEQEVACACSASHGLFSKPFTTPQVLPLILRSVRLHAALLAVGAQLVNRLCTNCAQIHVCGPRYPPVTMQTPNSRLAISEARVNASGRSA